MEMPDVPTKIHTPKIREHQRTRDWISPTFFFETLSLAPVLRLFILSFSELMEYFCFDKLGYWMNSF